MPEQTSKRSIERTGEIYTLGIVVVWGLFPVLTKLGLTSIGPLFSLAAATIFSFLLVAALVLVSGHSRHLLVKEAYIPILLATIINGVGYYFFVFSGVALTSAGNCGIILQMEVFFSFAFLSLLGQEEFNRDHLVGAAFMVTGAALALLPELMISNDMSIIKGDALITIACALAPIGNIYTRKARALVPSTIIMLIRSFVASVILSTIAYFHEGLPTSAAVSASLTVLILNGIFCMGISKLLWAEAIHRISISKAISLTSLSPAITLIIAFFVLGERPTWYQVTSIVPIMFGIFKLTRPAKLP